MRAVVCGGGVIGASCAYYLSLRGVETVIVEPLGIAAAASGRSGGFLARDWCDATPQQDLAHLSYSLHQQLAATVGSDYGYRPVTTRLVVASERRDVSRHGRVPAPAWLDGRGAVASTLGDPSNTAQLDPALLTRALVEAACRAGGRVIGAAARSLITTDGGLRATGVMADGEPVHADAVVIAIGPWTGILAAGLRLPPVAGLKGYSVVLYPHAPVPAEALFLDYETAEGARHTPEVISRSDGSVYVCGIGEDRARAAEEPGQVSVDPRACRELARVAGELSSCLRGARIAGMQACFRPICADALPIIGQCPGIRGAYVATAHNCWGMLNAPGTGLAISELVVDGASRCLDLSPFAPARSMTA